MAGRISEHLKRPSTWVRGLYMVLFAVLYGIAELLILAITVFQFLSVLFTGHVNEPLLPLARGLSAYIYQIMLFLTYITEQKPFPLSPWPRGPVDAEPRPEPMLSPPAGVRPEITPQAQAAASPETPPGAPAGVKPATAPDVQPPTSPETPPGAPTASPVSNPEEGTPPSG